MTPLKLLLGATALVPLATPACASVIVLVDGTIASGYDETGEFGVAGRDLTGLAYHVEFDFDETDPNAFQFIQEPVQSGLYTVAEASVTINEVTRSWQSSYYGDPQNAILNIQDNRSGIGFEDFFSAQVVRQGYGNIYANVGLKAISPEGSSLLSGISYLDNREFTLSEEDHLHGYEIDSAFLYVSAWDQSLGDYTHHAYATSEVAGTRFRVMGPIAASAVPEPATWALLILGFGLVGGALRGRARAAAGARMRLCAA